MQQPVVLMAMACACIPLFVLLAAWAHGTDGHQVNLDAVLAGMSAAHPLGSDALGRDVLARLGEGLRLSLGVGVMVVVIGATLGIMIGITAGWVGGWMDALLMRLADIVLSFPGILLAIALAAMLGPGIDKLVAALVAVGCGADANPEPRGARSGFDMVNRHGKAVAAEVERLLAGRNRSRP
jgi:peptide/nickel transport system permease protein